MVNKLETDLSIKLNVNYLNESVRTMLTTKQIAEKWGKFHFIYSMGLFDYLTPPAARVVIQKLFQLLEPGGEMIIGNFHVIQSEQILYGVLAGLGSLLSNRRRISCPFGIRTISKMFCFF